MAGESIFTKIIRGEIPCHKIYEDELTIAFLDIHPIQPGHTLVVSKEQIEFLWDLSDRDYLALMTTTKKVAARLREALRVRYVGLKVIGVDVPHSHVHVVPFNTVEEYRTIVDLNAAPDHTSLAEMAKKLAF